jgi:hypothetical protein
MKRSKWVGALAATTCLGFACSGSAAGVAAGTAAVHATPTSMAATSTDAKYFKEEGYAQVNYEEKIALSLVVRAAFHSMEAAKCNVKNFGFIGPTADVT